MTASLVKSELEADEKRKRVLIGGHDLEKSMRGNVNAEEALCMTTNANREMTNHRARDKSSTICSPN